MEIIFRRIALRVIMGFCALFLCIPAMPADAEEAILNEAFILAQNDEEVMEFEKGMVIFSGFTKQLIDDYLQKLRDKHQDTIAKADLALDNFGDVVRSAPVEVAQPDILAALVNGGFHKAIDEVLKLLTPAAPAFSVINATYKTIGSQLIKAGKASQKAHKNQKMVAWIEDQRDALASVLDSFNEDAILTRIDHEFLEHEDEDRLRNGLIDASNRLKENVVSIQALKKSYYEQWINSQFRKTLPEVGKASEDCGCVEIRMIFEKEGLVENLIYDSSTVHAMAGSNIAKAVNRIIDKNPDFDSIMELKVQKRACVQLSLSQGAKRWFCGWYNEANELIREPSIRKVREILLDTKWQLMIKKFKN